LSWITIAIKVAPIITTYAILLKILTQLITFRITVSATTTNIRIATLLIWLPITCAILVAGPIAIGIAVEVIVIYSERATTMASTP
jgi:hypothetical protein